MLFGEWLQIGKLNQITVVIDGKPVALRCTLSQVERFQGLKKPEEEEPVTTPLGARMKWVDVVEIALNPVPNKTEFTRDQIMEKLDLDQITLIAQIWLERKVFTPRIESDPLLAPPGASK